MIFTLRPKRSGSSGRFLRSSSQGSGGEWARDAFPKRLSFPSGNGKTMTITPLGGDFSSYPFYSFYLFDAGNLVTRIEVFSRTGLSRALSMQEGGGIRRAEGGLLHTLPRRRGR